MSIRHEIDWILLITIDWNRITTNSFKNRYKINRKKKPMGNEYRPMCSAQCTVYIFNSMEILCDCYWFTVVASNELRINIHGKSYANYSLSARFICSTRSKDHLDSKSNMFGRRTIFSFILFCAKLLSIECLADFQSFPKNLFDPNHRVDLKIFF